MKQKSKILVLFIVLISCLSCAESSGQAITRDSLAKNQKALERRQIIQKKLRDRYNKDSLSSNIVLPDPKTDLPTAKNWIKSYRNNPYDPTAPFSFIINAASLTDYLNRKSPVSLHIYLAYNHPMNDRLDFVMIGADNNTTHIPDNNMVFGNFKDCSSASAGVTYDANIDPYSFNAANFLAIPDNSRMPTLLAKQYISNYQYWFTDGLCYSFMIDAQALKQFLTDRSYQSPIDQADMSVPYLQVYFAYKNNDPAFPTLVFVGVGNSGKHIYYRYGGENYVLEQCVPCPFCGVTYDSGLDGPLGPQKK